MRRIDSAGEISFMTAANVPVVSGLGLVVLDQLAFIDDYPAPDSKVFASRHAIQVGGPVPTALAQLRRFRLATKLLASWAEDLSGGAIEDRLSLSGIEFDRATCRTARVSGFAHVWVESGTGRRTVVSSLPDGVPDHSSAARFGSAARVLHLDGWGTDAAVAAAEATRHAGGFVSLDSGSVKPATERLLPLVNAVNAPLRFITDYCGTSDAERGAKRLLACGPRLITVTDGERGAGIYTSDMAAWLPAFPVRTVDTCGAGDVFCGGLLYAVLVGMPPFEALRFAMATAAIKVSRPGNAELATIDDVFRFLESVDASTTTERTAQKNAPA
jgi:sugar/nucleoside kinase (ribokinase family)